ncbi:MAG: hypothetical protein F6K30_24455 [Cyanothece sp. SIO2G6]|nr:hypothetical protein [Cyanothece sp. SIO2G6]
MIPEQEIDRGGGVRPPPRSEIKPDHHITMAHNRLVSIACEYDIRLNNPEEEFETDAFEEKDGHTEPSKRYRQACPISVALFRYYIPLGWSTFLPLDILLFIIQQNSSRLIKKIQA